VKRLPEDRIIAAQRRNIGASSQFRKRTGMNQQALEGVRIIDISSYYAAPFVATLLADFGAEVIKVEPLEGEPMRGGHLWSVIGRNKKSITLDLRKPEGCELLRQLVATADALVDNYPAKVLEQRGIGWKDLSKLNPRLVMASVSCFGQSGPYADRPGNGTLSEGFGGLVDLTGPASGMPVMPSLPLGDAIGALNIALGVMMALYWRDTRGGRGQHIDASLFEPILLAISHAVSRWSPGKPPKRASSRIPTLPVRNVFATSDGQYVVTSTTTARHHADIVRLAGGDPASKDDPDPLVAAWIRAHPLKEVLDTLIAMRIPVAPVNDLETLIHDPQVAARGSLIRQRHPDRGEFAVTGPSPRMSATPGRHWSMGSELGQHNDDIYQGLLGLGPERIEALRAARVI